MTEEFHVTLLLRAEKEHVLQDEGVIKLSHHHVKKSTFSLDKPLDRQSQLYFFRQYLLLSKMCYMFQLLHKVIIRLNSRI